MFDDRFPWRFVSLHFGESMKDIFKHLFISAHIKTKTWPYIHCIADVQILYR